MLKAALSGNYVNFGVFRLYGDSALDDALGIFVKLLLSVTQNDLLVSWLCFCQFIFLFILYQAFYLKTKVKSGEVSSSD